MVEERLGVMVLLSMNEMLFIIDIYNVNSRERRRPVLGHPLGVVRFYEEVTVWLPLFCCKNCRNIIICCTRIDVRH